MSIRTNRQFAHSPANLLIFYNLYSQANFTVLRRAYSSRDARCSIENTPLNKRSHFYEFLRAIAPKITFGEEREKLAFKLKHLRKPNSCCR
jgi:hypothetical protein